MNPPVASDLERRLGSVATERLSVILGGSHVQIPSNLDCGARLRKVVGDDLFVLLVFHFAGVRIYVPQPEARRSTGNKRISSTRILRLTKAGWTVPRIARHLGCSERMIYYKRALLRSRAQPMNGNDK